MKVYFLVIRDNWKAISLSYILYSKSFFGKCLFQYNGILNVYRFYSIRIKRDCRLFKKIFFHVGLEKSLPRFSTIVDSFLYCLLKNPSVHNNDTLSPFEPSHLENNERFYGHIISKFFFFLIWKIKKICQKV